MKKIFVVLALSAMPALAQISVTPGAEPASAVEPAPSQKPVVIRRAVPVKAPAQKTAPAASATPAPEKKKGGFFSFFLRLFGGGEKAAPAVKPAPAPGARKPGQKTAAKPSAAPEASPKPQASPVRETPAQPEAKVQPAPVIPETPAFDTGKIKQQALQDPRVKALQEKMLSALNEHSEGGPEYKAAALEYTGALFEKMRALDPAHAEQITRKENATRRRLDAGLPIVQ